MVLQVRPSQTWVQSAEELARVKHRIDIFYIYIEREHCLDKDLLRRNLTGYLSALKTGG